MASSNAHNIFLFGSSPSPAQSSSSNTLSAPAASSMKHASPDDMDVTAPPSPLSPPGMPLDATAQFPDINMDNRPAQALEEDDSDSEDDQDGGVPLDNGLPSLPTINDLIDAMEWQLPTEEEDVDLDTPPGLLPANMSWPPTFSNPFGALYMQSAAGSLPSSFAHSSAAALMQQSLVAALGDADAQQLYSHGSDSDDLQEDASGLPSVSDHQAVVDVCKFIDHWAVAGGLKGGLGMIGLEASRIRTWERPAVITKEDLQGDRYDIQGINWEELDTTRDNARVARLKLSTKKTTAGALSAAKLANTESYFRFRMMNTTHRVSVAHFQLRNLIASTSQNDIYYASKSMVLHTDGSGQMESCAMDLTKSSGIPLHTAFSITTLTASEDVLVAGGFYGEYALTNLRSEVGEPPVQGYVTQEFNGITNHAHTFNSRSSGSPQAVFCSNDRSLRILDCTTNTFTHEFYYRQAINCAATSPNGRMRVIVGDFSKTLITDAQTGKPFEHLPGHTDHAFACAWADDGIHVATGSQDHTVVVWDARRWDTPLATLASIMSCPRSLRFSPVGGGRRVLFAAEAEDVVSVFDAVSFDKRQVLDFYGTTAGISVAPDGQSLYVANADGKFGGLMAFERASVGEQYGVRFGSASGQLGGEVEGAKIPRSSRRRGSQDRFGFGQGPWEWVDEGAFGRDSRVVGTGSGRARRGLGLGGLVV